MNTENQIRIEPSGKRIALYSPFCQNNMAAFHGAAGNFDKTKRAWLFANTPATHGMLENLFGKQSEAVVAVVRRAGTTLIMEHGEEWTLGGYLLARRGHRDGRVEMATGVTLYQGAWPAHGGSVKNPCVAGGSDIVLHVVVFRAFAERHSLEILPLEELETMVAEAKPGTRLEKFFASLHCDDETYTRTASRFIGAVGAVGDRGGTAEEAITSFLELEAEKLNPKTMPENE